ncbi:uncharacterized protein LOC143144675 [Ptiloglossa arizonensis]|uniref:uncharacterized protein LOC143144675 n=1 Tax=Ptiloglossa arizonensis TaxID=3350558 RepID=UPI003FA18BBF
MSLVYVKSSKSWSEECAIIVLWSSKELLLVLNGKQFGCETRGTLVLHYVSSKGNERQPVPTHLFQYLTANAL